jgi:saccharopine dehydrogenase (NAD+, L-lysine-forming)
MKILILGGYGNSGKLIAELLLRYTDSEIIIAGWNIHKAVMAANELGKNSNIGQISALEVDAADAQSYRLISRE